MMKDVVKIPDSDSYGTPQNLWESLNKEFNFNLDAAASSQNHKCLNYFDKEANSLSKSWVDYGSVWCNPPYSRGNIARFVEKGWRESLKGCCVVMLVRCDPSTNWFQDFVMDKADEVRFVDKRIKFIGGEGSYNFPCCIVVFNSVRMKYGSTLPVKTKFRYWGYE